MKIKNCTTIYLLLILLIMATTTGCSVIRIVVSHDSNLEKLNDGEHQFSLKNYETAKNIFKEIADETQKPEIRNIALYNLACTRIMLSESEADLYDAIKLFEKWNFSGSQFLYEENPMLAIQALKKQQRLLKQVLSNKEKQFSDKLDKKQSDIDKLQRQIIELETIDLELQEKKKPL